MYDRVLTNQHSGEKVALEITSFDWPPNAGELWENLRRLAPSLETQHRDSIGGSFTILGDINAMHEGKLFRGNGRREKRQRLDRWLVETGAQMLSGQSSLVPGVLGLRVIRQTQVGPLSITVPGANAHIKYPDWMLDLEAVIEGNVCKFEGVVAKRRWLLVTYPGIGGKLEVTGPMLRVPPEIDELFFVDQEDVSDDWPPRRPDMRYWIVEYSAVRPLDERLHYDHDSGKLTVTPVVVIDNQQGE